MSTDIKSAILAVCMVFLMVPFAAHASPVLRSGESVVVSDAQEVSGDFYAAGGSVNVLGKIAGDLYAIGGAVKVTSEIEEDLVVIGGTVDSTGAVGDDVRIAGGEISIAGEVGGDVIVLGGLVRILPTAKINGDVVFFGGEANIEGSVRGSVMGRSEAVRISGPVFGSVFVTTTQALELGDAAHIDGVVEYHGTWDVVRAPGSVVVGDIVKKDVSVTSTASSFSIVSLLVLLFTTLVYMKFATERVERFSTHILVSYGRYGLVGLVALVGIPLASAILMVTVIGIPLGLIVISAYVLALVLAWSLGGIVIGTFLGKYLERTETITLKWALIGTLAFALFSYIPVLGTVLVFALCLVAFGCIVSILYTRLRR